MSNGKSMPCMKDASHGEIWEEWASRAEKAGYTAHDARRIHVKWRSLGKKIAAGARV